VVSFGYTLFSGTFNIFDLVVVSSGVFPMSFNIFDLVVVSSGRYLFTVLLIVILSSLVPVANVDHSVQV